MRIYSSLLIGILTCLSIKSANGSPQKALNLTSNGSRAERSSVEFNHGGYQLPEIRRTGYENDPKSYLSYSGFQNAQDTTQLQRQFSGPHAGYPQYYEAPEPIIEIIIKDANETAPQTIAHPVVTKKKKEKVHVFYVNYKKDKDNKLHLETPIASLSNDDNDDEQEEVIDYPVPVTVGPPPKSTTLRTIIHPDSEKYHSNSNIRVTFGTDTNDHKEHILEEVNSESLQHEVIALPANKANRILRPDLRAGPVENGNFQKSATNNFYEFQRLPALQSPTIRDFSQQNYNTEFRQTPPQQTQQVYQQKQQKSKEQTQFQNNQNLPFFQHAAFDNKFPSLEELHKHAQYFVTHNSSPPPPQQQQHQQHLNRQFSAQQKPPTYNPISLPLKPNPSNNYQPNQQQQHQQYQKQNIQFSKQPQFVQQPHFVAISPPMQKEYANFVTAPQHNFSPKSQTQITTPQSAPVNKQQHTFAAQNFQHFSNNRQQSDTQRLNTNFKLPSTQDTELLKSIPKYEHHITETVPSSSNKNPYQPFGSKVLHDVPAPNLAQQNSQPNVIVNYNSAPATHAREYNTASTLNTQQYASSTVGPVYDKTPDGKQVMIVTPMPSTYTHKQLNEANKQTQSDLRNFHYSTPSSVAKIESTTASTFNVKNQYNQLPAEVPDDLREQLLSSGILENAQISVLDYDKTGGISLENLPKEHLAHFYNAGAGEQRSESKRVVSVVKPNAGNEKKIETTKQNINLKVVNEKKHTKSEVLITPTAEIVEDKQYHRYLPLKINGSQFPLPDSDLLKGKQIASVVVLTPVANKQIFLSENLSKDEQSNKRKIADDLLKSLVKKPTTENFKHWLEKEFKSELEFQSIILLVTKSSERDGQEIFLYDNGTGDINKLNGEFSSAFVNIAEENSSAEDLNHASILDQSVLQNMMQNS